MEDLNKSPDLSSFDAKTANTITKRSLTRLGNLGQSTKGTSETIRGYQVGPMISSEMVGQGKCGLDYVDKANDGIDWYNEEVLVQKMDSFSKQLVKLTASGKGSFEYFADVEGTVLSSHQ
jgi:hypothetical protein